MSDRPHPIVALATSQRDLTDRRTCRAYLEAAGYRVRDHISPFVLDFWMERAAGMRAELDARAESMGFTLPPTERTRALLAEAA